MDKRRVSMRQSGWVWNEAGGYGGEVRGHKMGKISYTLPMTS